MSGVGVGFGGRDAESLFGGFREEGKEGEEKREVDSGILVAIGVIRMVMRVRGVGMVRLWVGMLIRRTLAGAQKVR